MNDYIKHLEEENEKLREKVTLTEDEVNRVWGILDEVKSFVKTNPSFTISTDFKNLNEDISGKLFMVGKKKFEKFIIQFDNIQDWYNELVYIIEGDNNGR